MSTTRLVRRMPRDRRIGGRFTIGMPSSSWIVALEANTSKKRGTIERCTSGRRAPRSRSSVSS